MNIKRIISIVIMVIITSTTMLFTAGCGGKYDNLLDPQNPVSIKVWNYYSGAQAISFNALVEDFNDTVGRDKGIIVNSVSQSNINTLADNLIAAVDNDAEIPEVASIYPETGFILKQKGAMVPIEDYLTKNEWSEYVSTFVESGKFSEKGKIYGFPVSKSTEILAINKTDWKVFETAQNVSIDSIDTVEDLVVAAKKYYEWTDSLTPSIPEDGKALYGRDSIANYIYVGAARLGHTIFTIKEDGSVEVDIDKNTFKTLWDNYYIPYINGYFGSYERFRSGDMKTGKILAFTGSSSSVNYIDNTVTLSDESTHDIEVVLQKPLAIENQTQNVYVQQGASYYVMKTTEAKQYASTVFLKWFTEKEQNVKFSLDVGYSPVKKDANNVKVLTEQMEKSSEPSAIVLSCLTISVDIFNNNTTFTSPAFEQAKDLRTYLENSLTNIANTDRNSVVSAIAGGSSRANAVANYITNDYFETWFNTVKTFVQAQMS